MSLKRSNSSGKSFGAGGDAGGKIDRQELFDELKRLAVAGEPFTAVTVALAVGAGEPHVAKALLGLAAEGFLERADGGRYRATAMAEMNQAEFVKAYARASKVDSTRQRDLSEIGRLKQNNDVMRQRLLVAIAERDHYLAALRSHGIDPGPAPQPVAPVRSEAEASPAASPASAQAGGDGSAATEAHDAESQTGAAESQTGAAESQTGAAESQN